MTGETILKTMRWMEAVGTFDCIAGTSEKAFIKQHGLVDGTGQFTADGRRFAVTHGFYNLDDGEAWATYPGDTGE